MDDELALDLKKYQTDQIAATVVEILSVKESVLTVLRTVGWAFLAFFLLLFLLDWVAAPDLIEFFAFMVYALVLAVFLGFFLGLIRVANNLIGNIEQLLQMIINTARLAVRDLQKMQDGKAKLPSASEIVQHVYEDVFVPLIEKTVADSIGFIGVPLLWVYRATIGSGVRHMIARIKANAINHDQAGKIEAQADEGLRALASNADAIEATFNNAVDIAGYAVKMIRRFVLMPMQILFVVALIVALIPVLIFWLWLL